MLSIARSSSIHLTLYWYWFPELVAAGPIAYVHVVLVNMIVIIPGARTSSVQSMQGIRY